MPRLNKRYLFCSNSVSDLKFSITKLHSKICRLDRLSCEGINSLIPFLKEISSAEFESAIKVLLKKCFYVNRIFSEAVEFLSIWLEKSPNTLIASLKQGDLKEFFYKTEYNKDGYEWPFPKLLHAFLPVVEKADISPNLIMNYLFNNFDFLKMPKVFIWTVIGYDQLELRLKEIPKPFHEPLLKKMIYLYHRGNNLGPRTHRFMLLYKSESEAFQQADTTKIASYPKLG